MLKSDPLVPSQVPFGTWPDIKWCLAGECMIEILERPQYKVDLPNNVKSWQSDLDAFRIEYKTNIPENVLIDDVVSYLGEYRFNLQKYSYNLLFKDGKLMDPHRKESMENLTQRSIERKTSEWKSTSRERAEKEGIINLDRQLVAAKEGDTVVWASPPGKKEDGYGDYGFIFIGNVRVDKSLDKSVDITAIRVENPTIEQFNKAIYLLTGEKVEYARPEEFLANSRVIKEELKEGYVDALLGMSFSFKPNPQEQEKFKQIIHRMHPLIADFVHLPNNEKRKALNVLENYSLKLLKEQNYSKRENIIYIKTPETNLRIRDMIGDFGHEPPKVAGSCGSTGNKDKFTSSNIFSKGSFLNSSFGEQEWFHCPKCDYQADGPIGDTCPGCKLTKAEYARQTGVSCD